MINERLQDFTTGVMARSQISFGDVRRLQRDCLPQGIATRDEAESLIALHAKLVRADKAWAAWLVPALADLVMAQQVSGGEDAKAWLRAQLAQSPCTAALGRKITRHIRRQSAQPSAGESPDAQQRPRHRVRICKAKRIAARIAPIVRSEIIVQPSRPAVARPKRRTMGAPILPCEVWSAGIMEKHSRFQLARPAV